MEIIKKKGKIKKIFERKKHKHYTKSDILFCIINYIGFALFTIIFIYPFYYLIINTITNNKL
jgi:multiple sugar transport system permease protein/putative aldouronate transport system permease protein